MRIALVLLCFLVLAQAHAIQNGQVPGENHPAVGNTVAVLSDKGLCSGSIIGEDLILTAAHCLAGLTPQEVFVFFATPGELVYFDRWRLDQDRLRAVGDFEIDQGYGFMLRPNLLRAATDVIPQSDIGIIRLQSPMPTRVYHDPDFRFRSLPLYDGAEKPSPGELVNIAGFGHEGPMSLSRSHIARLTVGKLLYRDWREDIGFHVLSRYKGVQTCYGDSGGPLYIEVLNEFGEKEWAIAGIASGFPSTSLVKRFLHSIFGCNSSRDILYFAPDTTADWVKSFLDRRIEAAL